MKWTNLAQSESVAIEAPREPRKGLLNKANAGRLLGAAMSLGVVSGVSTPDAAEAQGCTYMGIPGDCVTPPTVRSTPTTARPATPRTTVAPARSTPKPNTAPARSTPKPNTAPARSASQPVGRQSGSGVAPQPVVDVAAQQAEQARANQVAAEAAAAAEAQRLAIDDAAATAFGREALSNSLQAARDEQARLAEQANAAPTMSAAPEKPGGLNESDLVYGGLVLAGATTLAVGGVVAYRRLRSMPSDVEVTSGMPLSPEAVPVPAFSIADAETGVPVNA